MRKRLKPSPGVEAGCPGRTGKPCPYTGHGHSTNLNEPPQIRLFTSKHSPHCDDAVTLAVADQGRQAGAVAQGCDWAKEVCWHPQGLCYPQKLPVSTHKQAEAVLAVSPLCQGHVAPIVRECYSCPKQTHGSSTRGATGIPLPSSPARKINKESEKSLDKEDTVCRTVC